MQGESPTQTGARRCARPRPRPAHRTTHHCALTQPARSRNAAPARRHPALRACSRTWGAVLRPVRAAHPVPAPMASAGPMLATGHENLREGRERLDGERRPRDRLPPGPPTPQP